jgi:serine/threonine protein kinase
VVKLPPKVGRYEIIGHLASGGMAEILLARLTGPSGFERLVVVKRILPHFASMEAFVSMFLDEARIVARIRHSNVVQVQELGREGEDLFLVMEYLEGETAAGLLKRAIVRERPLDLALGAHMVAEACAGLHAAHELRDVDGTPQSIVHRDVSPQNLFVTYDGEVKVLDFGIAKTADRITRTESGQLKGKIEYMSPEQCRGEALDRRSDVFALGTVLCELTMGRRLFKRESQLATLKAISEEPVVPPSRVDEHYPRVLEPIVLRALERRPEDRYATAAEMRKELVAAIRQLRPGDNDVQEALASTMGALFEDRIREKREMILRVRNGSSVTDVPAGEVDLSVDVPIVHTNVSLGGDGFPSKEADGTHMSSLLEARPRSAGSRARGIIVAALATSALVAGLLLVRANIGDRSLSAVPPGQTATAPTPASSSGALPAAPEASSSVALHLESQPPGARVVVAGQDRGATPLDLSVPRGEDPLNVELRAKGFEPRVEVLKPSVDQHVFVTLVPTPTPATPTRAPARSPTRARPGGPPSAAPVPVPQSAPTPSPPPPKPADPFQKFN